MHYEALGCLFLRKIANFNVPPFDLEWTLFFADSVNLQSNKAGHVCLRIRDVFDEFSVDPSLKASSNGSNVVLIPFVVLQSGMDGLRGRNPIATR
jgi:hypothetical protein